ncbi:MAG: hypothetical protein EA419_08185 [Wenzhouxiangella sp.]|nr:MAG: hypothetical protein EA419_08185 [Wenzhouxiangella sp.]
MEADRMGKFDIDPPDSTEPEHRAALHLTIFGAWLLAFGAAALLEYAPNASLWFPPAAVTFAAVVVLGVRALPVIWLACLVVTVLADQVYQRGMSGAELAAAGFAFAFTHSLAYAALGLVFRSAGRRASPVPDLHAVGWFVLGGVAASGISSALGGLSMIVTGMSEPGDVAPLIITWWVGDFAGLVTIGPLLALLLIQLTVFLGIPLPGRLDRLPGPTSWSGLLRTAGPGLGLLIGLTLSILLLLAAFPGYAAMPLLLLACLPVSLWIARTESALATLVGVAGFSLILAAATGPLGLADHALALQLMVICLAIASYLGLAMAGRRQKRSADRARVDSR